MRSILCSAVALVSLGLSPAAFAVPVFDLIVPSHIDLTSKSGNVGITSNNGLWIAATTDTLVLSDFSDVDIGIAIDDSRISASGFLLNERVWSPLLTGQVVGATSGSTDYASFLAPEESFVESNPFAWSLAYPEFSDVLGQYVMSWSIAIGDQRFFFDTILNLRLGPEYALELEGQRITSAPVPEPSTFALIGIGLAGLGVARRPVE